MATIMLDPVILPSSRVILDRATIKSHLLSVSTDPYSRAPLKIEDVVPGLYLLQHSTVNMLIMMMRLATELRTRIQEFLIERRKKNAPPLSEDVEMGE